MDTTPGRTRARATQDKDEDAHARLDMAEDDPRAPWNSAYSRGDGKPPPMRPRQGYHAQGKRAGMSKVKCYNCDNFGHFARDCRRPRREKKDSRARTNQPDEVIFQGTAKEKASAWLRAVSQEDEDTKNAILKELMGEKDFLDA